MKKLFLLLMLVICIIMVAIGENCISDKIAGLILGIILPILAFVFIIIEAIISDIREKGAEQEVLNPTIGKSGNGLFLLVVLLFVYPEAFGQQIKQTFFELHPGYFGMVEIFFIIVFLLFVVILLADIMPRIICKEGKLMKKVFLFLALLLPSTFIFAGTDKKTINDIIPGGNTVPLLCLAVVVIWLGAKLLRRNSK
jgi:hypothetical protein